MADLTNKPIHLRFSLIKANYMSENRHPQVIMRDLGITYQISTPQSMCDQWWFWNCENLPKKLPRFLTPLDLNPMDLIDRSLTKKEAESIRDYANNKN